MIWTLVPAQRAVEGPGSVPSSRCTRIAALVHHLVVSHRRGHTVAGMSSNDFPTVIYAAPRNRRTWWIVGVVALLLIVC